MQHWSNANVDFLSTEMVPSAMIAVMHELLVALSSTMKRYYDRATMGIVMVQALKFCAAPSVDQVIGHASS